MESWWEIEYFDRAKDYRRLDSSMMPFRLLPELEEQDIKNGHKFGTDQFTIKLLVDEDISLHMPTSSIWLANKPHFVKAGSRVVLFKRSFNPSDGKSWMQLYLGILDEDGDGVIASYNKKTGESEVNRISLCKDKKDKAQIKQFQE